LKGLRIVREAVPISRCIADVVRTGEIDGAEKITALDAMKNTISPRKKSSDLKVILALMHGQPGVTTD
jgi:hypothetical protein